MHVATCNAYAESVREYAARSIHTFWIQTKTYKFITDMNCTYRKSGFIDSWSVSSSSLKIALAWEREWKKKNALCSCCDLQDMCCSLSHFSWSETRAIWSEFLSIHSVHNDDVFASLLNNWAVNQDSVIQTFSGQTEEAYLIRGSKKGS